MVLEHGNNILIVFGVRYENSINICIALCDPQKAAAPAPARPDQQKISRVHNSNLDCSTLE